MNIRLGRDGMTSIERLKWIVPWTMGRNLYLYYLFTAILCGHYSEYYTPSGAALVAS